MGLILLTYKGGFGNNRKLPEDLRQCKSTKSASQYISIQTVTNTKHTSTKQLGHFS